MLTNNEEDFFLTVEDILRELDEVSIFNHTSRSGISYQRSQKFKADIYNNDDLLQIYYLVDSHVPTLRERTAMRYERLLENKEMDKESSENLNFLKYIISTKCPSNADEGITEMLKQIAEMPKEWTLVQLTSQHTSSELQNLNYKKYETNDLRITVFNCGQAMIDPFMVKADKPLGSNNKMELVQELISLVDENRERLTNTAGQKTFRNLKEKIEYCRSRERVEENMRMLVKKIETAWLREWRCLFIGKFQDDKIEQYIKSDVESILKKENIYIQSKHKEILYRVVKGLKYLSNKEIERAVEYCLACNDDESSIKRIIDNIRSLNQKISTNFKNISRHPVILIVDECLDFIPWEMIGVLENEPVSRLPSLHFVYLLYKTHEKDIENGHKVIRNYKNGSYVVNPDRNLDIMEKRMMGFYKYWVPDWHGISDRKPVNDEFIKMLTDSELFAYNGHGNGSHIMSMDLLQREYVKAVVMLFGCASIKIRKLGPRAEMYGSYHMYLISRCPCVVGMLWEVTDADTDTLTAEFISNWVPSSAPVHWSNVDKTEWLKGTDINKFTQLNVGKEFNNVELLRALCHSKSKAKYYMTKAACVVRGLPVKIK